MKLDRTKIFIFSTKGDPVAILPRPTNGRQCKVSLNGSDNYYDYVPLSFMVAGEMSGIVALVTPWGGAKEVSDIFLEGNSRPLDESDALQIALLSRDSVVDQFKTKLGMLS